MAGDLPPPDDPSKFFLFHAAGISVDTAQADLGYCIGQAGMVLPSTRGDRWVLGFSIAMFGVGGGVNASFAIDRANEIETHRIGNAVMRKCMGLLGYDRYAMGRDAWKTMVDDGDIVLDDHRRLDPATLHRMAVFAAGPVPAGSKLPR